MLIMRTPLLRLSSRFYNRQAVVRFLKRSYRLHGGSRGVARSTLWRRHSLRLHPPAYPIFIREANFGSCISSIPIIAGRWTLHSGDPFSRISNGATAGMEERSIESSSPIGKTVE